MYCPKSFLIWPWSSYSELPPKLEHCQIGITHQILASKEPCRVVGPSRGLSCPFCFIGYVGLTSSMCLPVLQIFDACAYSLSSWLGSISTQMHIIWWSCLTCGPTYPSASNIASNFLFWHFPLYFRSFWSWLVLLWHLNSSYFSPRHARLVWYKENMGFVIIIKTFKTFRIVPRI